MTIAEVPPPDPGPGDVPGMHPDTAEFLYAINQEFDAHWHDAARASYLDADERAESIISDLNREAERHYASVQQGYDDVAEMNGILLATEERELRDQSPQRRAARLLGRLAGKDGLGN